MLQQHDRHEDFDRTVGYGVADNGQLGSKENLDVPLGSPLADELRLEGYELRHRLVFLAASPCRQDPRVPALHGSLDRRRGSSQRRGDHGAEQRNQAVHAKGLQTKHGCEG